VQTIPPYLAELDKEIRQIPAEFLPFLLSIVKSYRQSLLLTSAEDSFKQGWQEALQGETYPITELWQDMD
jgi:hypothetical protein